MNEIIIDATNSIAGRLASHVAKQALLGNKISVINSEKAVMTGNKDVVAEKYRYRRSDQGRPQKGPIIYRTPDRFLKRIIRGMLPYKRQRGAEAFKNIKCYKGVPPEFKDKKAQLIKPANVAKLTVVKYTTVAEICKYMGGKI